MKNRVSVWKGAIAGAAGGLVASWSMNQFQTVWSAVSKRMQDGDSNSKHKEQDQSRQEQEQSEDATMKAADAAGRMMLRRRLTREEKKKAAPLVHYGFGALVGGIYGAASEKVPTATAGGGLAFGTAVFIGADEVAVPALGLAAQSPLETSVSEHLFALASHLVYGTATEMVRKGVRKILK